MIIVVCINLALINVYMLLEWLYAPMSLITTPVHNIVHAPTCGRVGGLIGDFATSKNEDLDVCSELL